MPSCCILSYAFIAFIIIHQSRAFNNKFKEVSSKCVNTRIPSTIFSTAVSTPDDEGLRKKNEIRKKYNLPPLSKEEYDDLQQQVNMIQAEQEEALQRMAISKEDDKPRNNFFENVMGKSRSNKCESNYDCVNPNEICCDLLIKKVCCSSGIGVKRKLALVKVTARS